MTLGHRADNKKAFLKQFLPVDTHQSGLAHAIHRKKAVGLGSVCGKAHSAGELQ
jgi:hypothetical protein